MAAASKIDRISVPGRVPPTGHYSAATAWHDLVFVSGQLPTRADGTHTAEEAFEIQARQVLDNLLAVLAAAGSSPAHVLKVTAYIVGVEHWPAFNAVYADIFGEAKPARAIVPVPELHHGYLVEVEAVAVR